MGEEDVRADQEMYKRQETEGWKKEGKTTESGCRKQFTA